MNLTIDIGNTCISLCFFKNRILKRNMKLNHNQINKKKLAKVKKFYKIVCLKQLSHQ